MARSRVLYTVVVREQVVSYFSSLDSVLVEKRSFTDEALATDWALEQAFLSGKKRHVHIDRLPFRN